MFDPMPAIALWNLLTTRRERDIRLSKQIEKPTFIVNPEVIVDPVIEPEAEMEVDTVTQDEDNEDYLTDDDYDNECSDDELPLPFDERVSYADEAYREYTNILAEVQE